MAHIFISYARQDGSQVASTLAARLRAREHEVFLDVESIRAGARWRSELQRRIKWSDVIVVLVTLGSNQSDFVFEEVRQAENNRKWIIPVQIGETPLPVHLRGSWQAITLNNENIDRVLLEIEHAAREQAKPSFRRFNLTVAVVVLLIVLAIVGALIKGNNDRINTEATANFSLTQNMLAQVVRTNSEINIDGLLNEPAWSEAMPLVYAGHPTENGSTTATVRFLWNNDYLYVGFDINDTNVETADLSALWDGDSVSVLLHDGGIAEHRQSLGQEQNDVRAYQLQPMTTLNDPTDVDAGYTVEIEIQWQDPPVLGRRIPADLLSVDHDANPGGNHDAPTTIFSKLTWDGDGDITTAGANLLLVDRRQ